MSKLKKILKISLPIAIIIFAIVSYYVYNLEDFTGKIETVIIGQSALSAGSEAGLRVIALNHKDNTPIPNARIKLEIAPKGKWTGKKTLYQGVTNKDGTADINFTTPDDIGNYDLYVTTSSNIGKDKITKTISLERNYKILLTTDKTLYQPSQTIHIRALALQKSNLKPYNGNITLEVEDSKGNKVFKKISSSNEFGVASADFVLADEINLGRYTVSAIIENTKSEVTVTVDKYVLPKFKIDFSIDKNYQI
ncbi:MAG: MG2 domain-containing protein [Methanosarcinales archaeon]